MKKEILLDLCRQAELKLMSLSILVADKEESDGAVELIRTIKDVIKNY